MKFCYVFLLTLCLSALVHSHGDHDEEHKGKDEGHHRRFGPGGAGHRGPPGHPNWPEHDDHHGPGGRRGPPSHRRGPGYHGKDHHGPHDPEHFQSASSSSSEETDADSNAVKADDHHGDKKHHSRHHHHYNRHRRIHKALFISGVVAAGILALVGFIIVVRYCVQRSKSTATFELKTAEKKNSKYDRFYDEEEAGPLPLKEDLSV